MSKETYTWLNNNVLVGFTAKRGNAWHYKASEQGSESNHYEAAIPVDDVLRRLFAWKAVELPVFVRVPAGLDDMTGLDDMGQPFKYIQADGRKAIAADDTYEVLGMFKDGYQPHQYSEWLLNNVANVLDDELAIGSAGLLRNRAQAWVSVEVPENITTPEGVTFRPNLIACTSFDGSLSTTYKRTITAVVCDNTLAAGLSESGQVFRVKHTRNSAMRIGSAREALAIIHSAADDFAAEVKALCEWSVTDAQFKRLLDKLVPDSDSKRSMTLSQNKRDKVLSLWERDPRVSPWHGSAFGVLQAFNTYNHHHSIVRGAGRVERNMTEVLSGRFETQDNDVLSGLKQLQSV